jgi:hypothetical protein
LATVGDVEEESEPDEPRIVDVDGMELHLDAAPDANGEVHTALPPRLEAWRRRSAAGAILTGIGLGLKAALEPERDEPSIIMQASGTPPTDLSVEAELGGILPADNVVKIRPWLLTPPSAAATAGSPLDGTPVTAKVAQAADDVSPVNGAAHSDDESTTPDDAP